MGRLGDVLEALYGPDDRFRTIEATVRWSFQKPPGVESQLIIGLKKKSASTGPPKPVEEAVLVWISWPFRARIERRREADGGIETRLEVIDGPRRWERDAQGHVDVTNKEQEERRAPQPGAFSLDIDSHFCPQRIRELFFRCSLESLGPVRVAGRDCERIRAIPRGGGGIWPAPLPFEVGTYEFRADVDRERGVILGLEAINRGDVFATSEVIEVAFDVPLGDELFSYEPASGEQVEPKADTFERLSLAKAVARMPFTVLVPTRVPNMDRSACHIMYRAFRRGGGWSYLLFQYPRTEGGRSLLVCQGRGHDPELDQYEWEQVDVAGGVLKDLRISDPGGDSGSRLVVFEQAGTHVKIQSNLDRERLIDLATSFVPAEGGPASPSD